ncbi:beta-N-acetylhexosaminidase [Flavitalea flava]
MKKFLLITVVLVNYLHPFAQGLPVTNGESASEYSSGVNRTHDLMPVPQSLQTNGHRMAITEKFRVAVSGNPDRRLFAEASRFIRRVGEKTGFFLDKQGYLGPQDNDPSAPLRINVRRPGKLTIKENEQYAITITAEQAVIDAETDLGAIHGLETLLQLISVDEGGYYFPGLIIRDAPRFAWRGLLLDVALHFMPVDVIKRTLDGMAASKMNVLHLHLSNDQGFRVESKVFPQLQRTASDGKYYTQSDIHAIVAYAGQRGIRIVPEFVVPAHTTAILVAFPELASVKKNYTLQRYFGVFDPVMDPTNEKVLPFLDRLFAEMTALFPDDYFHIGGDENTGKDWEKTPHIKAYMKAKGMKNYIDLQTEFNRHLLPIIKKHGKKMMGWDEILQPGVPKDIVIQSWRGKEAFYSSVRQGYPAILSNGYYIDLVQHTDTLYLNDPIPDGLSLTKTETANILGGEATMWSELITPETVDSRIWPRTAAIAERLWSPREVTNLDDMYRRLDIMSLHLEAVGLTHESYQQPMLRRLANSEDIQAVKVLVDVLEPLKIYERNQGDTMYTVFSPYTKLADVALPDQPVPRMFNRDVKAYISNLLPGPKNILEKSIREQLTLWKENHAHFLLTVRNSPILREGLALSQHLSLIASRGLEALDKIAQGKRGNEAWLKESLEQVGQAKEQGGRCELQVVSGIEGLIRQAAK